ncbi:MAG TPA: tetratricopeptide repeat protein [Candidatus Sulfopaludibacter sp.]|nr:tetratricopeptide repeat protein [Candidatus Sulfopaludibacter sp.]
MTWVWRGVLSLTVVTAAAGQPQKAWDLNQRGLEASTRGDFAGARRDMAEALAIWQSAGREYELHAAIEMMNLGDVLCALGNWNEGVKLFEQALERNRAMRPRDLATMANMNRLANAYGVRGELDRAGPLYRDALAIERELYANELQTAHSLIGLASLESRRANLAEALAAAEEGLAITLRAVGENDPEAGLAYSEVAQLHRMEGRVDRALPLLRKAQAIFERTLGPNSPRVGSVLSQQGLALLYEGKPALAEQDLVRAMQLLSQPGGSSVERAVAEHNLGLLRMRQKKYREADGLFVQALSIEEQYSAQPGIEMEDTLKMLSQVREKERRFDDAARFRDRANAIQSYR